ncbi:transferase [Auriculariales sp. MPI-PUGE-AT-0066]|nr:transferase [Auriculariales sp. MPI-PUGE-AT-0066]
MTETVGGPLDQVPFRGYIPQLFAIPTEQVDIQLLRRSFASLLRYAPLLGGHVDEDETGRVKLVLNDTSDLQLEEALQVVNLPNFSYRDWRKNRFPYDDVASHFEDAVPKIGTYPLPILGAQLTIMSGGVALCLWFHHSAIDGGSSVRLWSAWAAVCRGEEIPDLLLLPRLEPTLVSDIYDLDQHHGYAHSGFSILPPAVAARLHFPSEKLATLKAVTSAGLPEGQWISTHDALNALIWVAVQRAKGKETSLSLAFSINVRSRLAPPVPESYIGNAFYMAIARSGGSSLADYALAVRQANNAVTAEKLEDFLRAAAARPDLYEAHNNSDGPLLITSWADFPLGGLDWGQQAFGGVQPDRIMQPLRLRANLAVVYAKLSSTSGIDVEIGLEPDEMDRLLGDEELKTFAEWDGGYGMGVGLSIRAV